MMKKMTAEEVYRALNRELAEVEDECVAEGLPSNGLIYELRAQNVIDWWRESYPEFF